VKTTRSILLAIAGMGLTTTAYAAPSNQPPPAGAILDLAGQPITNSQQSYSVNFNAGLASTAITFAFRQDPSFESFSNVSLVDLTTSSGNLLTNGDFAGGTYTNNGNSGTPVGWTYANIYGATFGGVVQSGCGVGGSNCWYDGAVQAYDAISQTVATNIGDVYQISFNLNGGSGGTGFYQPLSTNGNVTDTGGNGIDVLAYAQAGLPVAGTVPEPATWAMMLLGFGVMGFAMRSRPSVRGQRFSSALSR
jgi:hypothetical protein